MSSLATLYRPKSFDQIVGQESEVAILQTILRENWKPSALLFTGAFGCGKTTLARLMARSILCENRTSPDPCNSCPACTAMDNDNHPAYHEKDAASEGLVGDVRVMKEEITYKSSGPMKILYYDESHMLSTPAQNAMLNVLEEGVEGVLFMFATTEVGKMLPTIRSRCVELDLKLLSSKQICGRLSQICTSEGITYEDRALSVIGTYVRGHMRDAIILLEQLSKLQKNKITEEAVRIYLRMDRYVDVYTYLTLGDRAEAFEKLEALLCNYSPVELADLLAEVLISAYKVQLNIGTFTQVDLGWLKRIGEIHGDTLLKKAEAILSRNLDFATIQYAMAVVGSVFFTEEVKKPTLAQTSGAALMMRKPGK